MRQLRIGHQKYRLDVVGQMTVGQQHRELGRHIGERPDAANHDLRLALPHEFDGQSGERANLHVATGDRHAPDHRHTFLGGE